MNYTLITGASFGIGSELAKEFASNGHNLILIARSENILNELSIELKHRFKIDVHAFQTDLSKKGAAEGLFAKIQAAGFKINVLVNNAGFGYFGYFEKSELQTVHEMIQVNITALTELCRLILPAMLQNKSGKILNVASTASFQPGPMMSQYFATKAYVLHFSEALSEELKGTGVFVTALCPGPTISNFGKVANTDNLPVLKLLNMPTSRNVAKFGYKALMSNSPIAVHGLFNRILAKFVSVVPRSILRAVVMKLMNKKTA